MHHTYCDPSILTFLFFDLIIPICFRYFLALFFAVDTCFKIAFDIQFRFWKFGKLSWFNSWLGYKKFDV